MKTIDEFRRFYETFLRDDLEVLEQTRKDILKKVLISAGIVFIAAAFLSVLFRSFSLWFMAAGLGIWGCMYIRFTSGYKKSFKQEVIKRIIAFIDPGLVYVPEKYIPEAVFRASRIFLRSADKYSGDDFICGKIGETQIQCSEVHAQYKTETTDSKGHRRTHWHTIFKGMLFAADFNKNFNGATVVLPDAAQSLLGSLGVIAQSWNIMRGELIRLEDPEFERLFVVYGNDQVEARYILSTALMKRITDFKNKSGKKVFLSFVESKIYVAVSYEKEVFEPALSKTLFEFASFLPYFEDACFLAGIVDDLNLNTRVWSKV